MTTNWLPLDYKSPSAEEKEIIDYLDRYIIGQDRAKRKIAAKLIMYRHGLNDPTKPPAVLLFPGPSGVGKTHMVRIFTKLLLGHENYHTRIDCSTFQEEHTISRLLGSPPGYVGYGAEPELSQEKLDMPGFRKYGPKMTMEVIEKLKKLSAEIEKIVAKEKELDEEFDKILKKENPEDTKKDDERLGEICDCLQELDGKKEIACKELADLKAPYEYKPGSYPAVALFDEIEKMHPKITRMLLPIFDFAEVKTASNKNISFKKTFIFMTSNIGRDELANELAGKGTIGIKMQNGKDEEEDIGKRMYRIVMRAIEKNVSFPPELLGRIGKEDIIVFHPLDEKSIRKIIDIKLLENLVRTKISLSLKVLVTNELKDLVYKESQDGMNKILGARPVEKIVKTRIAEPLANLVIKGSDGGIVQGDFIRISTAKVLKDGEEKEVVTFEKAGNPNHILTILP